jgi:NAD(P)-dependent dehydrogenase (short-subunit alcohol dehydrogenase family)
MQGELSELAEITRTSQEIEAKHGKLDVLIVSAAVAAFGSLENVTAEQFYRLFSRMCIL